MIQIGGFCFGLSAASRECRIELAYKPGDGGRQRPDIPVAGARDCCRAAFRRLA